ncbi:MAG: methylenetetrahydrofolate reductase [Deltaproteobacteria bacterium]|nr:methylenetetrahydrofolate reductase [Deltaproteobacteria bacterium]
MSFKKNIASGEFLFLGEFDPPKGTDFSTMLECATRVKGRLDAIVVPEMSSAVLKASSLGGCAFLQAHGFETILQVCCRDRNRLALQADILAANAMGIKNIMAVPGDDIRFGDHPQARTVNDLDLLQLIGAVETLKSGRDMAGIELNGKPEFLTGSIINAGAIGGLLDMELENLNRMIDSGIRFVITTPVFDIHRFRQFVRRIDMDRISVIPTVMLLKSAGMARYIDRNIKNISIPSEIIRDIQKAPDKPKACVEIAAEMIKRIRDIGMAGVMISTLGWEDKLPRILDAIKH